MFECFQFSLVILSIIFYKRENFFKTFLIILSLEKVFILCKKSSHNPALFWTALQNRNERKNKNENPYF